MLILKIIGILLLILLGLLFLAVLLTLFVPVRYMVSGEMEEEQEIRFGITWLLHAISWQGRYRNGAFTSGIRILGIRKRTKAAPFDIEEEEIPFDEEADTEAVCSGESDEATANVSTDESGEGAANLSSGESDKSEKDASAHTFKERRGAEHIFSKLPEKFRHLEDIFTHWRSTVADIKKEILDETNKIAVFGILAELKYLLGRFKFRKVDANLRFSLADPARTGQALGILAMMPYLYRYRFDVYPDFESDELYVKGKFRLKGRAHGIHVLISLLRLMRKKEFRSFFKRIMNKN